MSTLKVTHLQNESNAEPAITITSAGAIGIGTETPRDPVHIFHPTNNVNLLIESGDANSYLAFKDNTTTSDAAVYLGAEGNNLKFITSATERLRLTSSGNVNIGPSANANDHGLLTLSQTALSAFNALVIQQGNTQFTATDGLHIGIDAGVHAYFKLYENRDIYFTTGTSNTEKLRISNDDIIETGSAINGSGFDGNQRLRVGRGGDCNIAIRATASVTASTGVDFGDTDDDRAGRIQYMHNGDYMSFHTNGAGSGLSNERLRITSAGKLLLPTGSPGIQFGSPDSSGNIVSQTLDDYEEGTFTPTVSVEGQGNAVTDKQYGRYVKVGKMVTVWCYVQLNGTPAGRATNAAWQHGGLPFVKQDVANGADTPGAIIYWTIGDTSNLAGTGPYMLVARLFNNTAGGRIRAHSSDAVQSGQNASYLLQNNTEYSYTFTYEASA